ncbi:MAG: hypothetical protein MJA29_14625 [Candidatus Omnitrophica bacterium]|nr:hypothetical protein [Candidatus Omnitrophota bacterium]
MSPGKLIIENIDSRTVEFLNHISSVDIFDFMAKIERSAHRYPGLAHHVLVIHKICRVPGPGLMDDLVFLNTKIELGSHEAGSRILLMSFDLTDPFVRLDQSDNWLIDVNLRLRKLFLDLVPQENNQNSKFRVRSNSI